MAARSKKRRIGKNSRVSIFRLLIAVALFASFSAPIACLAQTTSTTSPMPTMEDLKLALDKSEANPASPALRFEYADTLRKMGKLKQAAHQYMAVTDIDASYYVAYHMLAKHCKDVKILKEATRRLDHLKGTKPKELMLRVALSELLEAQGDYYKASRSLVDIVFLDAVPTKYKKKVHARIRYLQAKARDSHAGRSTGNQDSIASENDPPLPEESIKRGLAASSIQKDDNFGNASLKR